MSKDYCDVNLDGSSKPQTFQNDGLLDIDKILDIIQRLTKKNTAEQEIIQIKSSLSIMANNCIYNVDHNIDKYSRLFQMIV